MRPKTSTVIHAGTEGNALSVNVKANKIYFVGYQDNFLTVVDGVTNQPTRIARAWLPSVGFRLQRDERPALLADARTTMRSRSSIRGRDVVSTVGTGNVPMAAAVNDVTNRIYVVNYGSSDVTVIDGGSHRPIATVKVGLWPQQIAINTKTNMIYVVNTHANSVSVIDGRTNTVAATVPADKGAVGGGGQPGDQHDLCRQPAERQGHRDRWPHESGGPTISGNFYFRPASFAGIATVGTMMCAYLVPFHITHGPPLCGSVGKASN